MKGSHLIQETKNMKQFHILLDESTTKWVEEAAKSHDTSLSNIIRHALNMTIDMEAMKEEYEAVCHHYDKEHTEIDVRHSMDEFDDQEHAERIRENSLAELEAGYALREKYATMIANLPDLPKAPMLDIFI